MAFPTGRTDEGGRPLYGFTSGSKPVLPEMKLTHQGHSLQSDRSLYELGKLEPGSTVMTATPQTPGPLPQWAMHRSKSLLDPKTNQPFINEVVKQLGAEMTRGVNEYAIRYPREPGVRDLRPPYRAADLKAVRITAINNHGQVEGKLLNPNGRMFTIAFDVATANGVRTFTSDIRDPFFIDPMNGGRFIKGVSWGTPEADAAGLGSAVVNVMLKARGWAP